MTDVIVAKTAGFCFGVTKAVEKVYQQAEEGITPIYTYGPIIHNEEVVADLERKGVRVISDEAALEQIHEGTIVIRSHGVGRTEEEKMRSLGLQVVDATCPFVKKIHRIVSKASEDGRSIIIIGSAEHPEVKGIRGWCGNSAYVIGEIEEVETLPALDRVTVVSQTTFNYKKFKEIVEKIKEKRYDSCVVNTICNATQERQVEARQIAGAVEAMIVIGGKNSSNTQKLYNICKDVCPHTYYIQTLVDLEPQGFPNVRSVGITAGASTPKNIIEEVHSYVRSKL